LNNAVGVAPPGTQPRANQRYRVIWNPHAGTKGGLPINVVSGDALREVLERHGLPAEIVETDDEGMAETAARKAVLDGVDVVVAAGGDGTVALVAGQLLGTSTALGVLPMGSIMNIARSLGIPRDLDAAAAVLAQNTIRLVDVGEVAGHPFYETASVGMNAAIFREADRFDDTAWSSILRTIWVAIRYRPARMVVRLDDRLVRTRALMVTISNGRYMGAGMTVAPDARIDDGMFDVRIFRGFSKLELLRHLATIAFGRRRYSPRISTYRSARVRITSVHPLPARADRRDLGTTPMEVVTRPQALRVVHPATPRPDPQSGIASGRRRL
jgi:diacylglycerol kinase (ATP)